MHNTIKVNSGPENSTPSSSAVNVNADPWLPASVFERRLARIPKFAAFMTFLVAIILLAVWLLMPEWKAVSSVTMKANTAFALMLCSISLWLTTKNIPAHSRIPHLSLSVGASVAACLIGGLTLLQYISGWSLGIDEILVTDFPNDESKMFPGRMSPIAATCFLLFGASTLLLIKGKSENKVSKFGLILVFALFILSLQAIAGYLYGVHEFYQFRNYIRISLTTAICFMLLSVGILFSKPSPIPVLMSPGLGGVSARLLLGPAVAIPISLGWVRLHLQKMGYFELELGTSLLVVTLVITFSFIIILNSKTLEAVDAERASVLESFKTLADSLPQLTWMADPSGQVFWYNQRWYDYSGTDLEQMKGWGWKKIHHPDHVDRIVKSFSKSVKTGEPWEDLFPLRSKTGEYRWFLSRAQPVKDAQGKIVRWFGSNTDVTEQRKSQEDLKTALRARDEFLSIASHELKTPITSLKLQAQLMKRMRNRSDASVYDPKTVDRLIDQSENQLNRLTLLVDDMFDITNINLGRLAIHKKPIALCQIVTDVIERLGPNLKDAGISIDFVCPDPVVGSWDRFRMEQVVTNLATNAMKYGHKKPVVVRINRDPQNESRVTLSVQDQGIGIAPDSLDRIFNRFERAVSANEVSGLGLGLFITRQIVDAHQGRIWAESKGAGQGSTFFVDLPLSAVGSVTSSDLKP